ncbi:acyl-ACP--UDP-N-acetylglucosamine O-acyltransferase [Ectothiorhodospiraceae bacterium BW-2]|nr:acyl-ACP--UDP-N-acetylglucosamine O-acyltransferase [Ectothiorhodospiraceae bacterium BW-2]
MAEIHRTAVIDPSANIAEGVRIGPYTIIGAGVTLGARCDIGPHVVISGPTVMGCDNRVFQFASIGAEPQDKTYRGEATRLVIGDRNTIREAATINRGTVKGGGETRIGNDNLLMAYIHIAHDCQIGHHTIFSNNASLAGHVTVDDHAILSGFTLVHQFCAIGAHAFTAMGSAVTRDVPPYLLVAGNVAEPHGINSEGLKRRGFKGETIRALKRAYKRLYRSGLPLKEALTELETMVAECAEIAPLVQFIQQSQRGIIR